MAANNAKVNSENRFLYATCEILQNSVEICTLRIPTRYLIISVDAHASGLTHAVCRVCVSD